YFGSLHPVLTTQQVITQLPILTITPIKSMPTSTSFSAIQENTAIATSVVDIDLIHILSLPENVSGKLVLYDQNANLYTINLENRKVELVSKNLTFQHYGDVEKFQHIFPISSGVVGLVGEYYQNNFLTVNINSGDIKKIDLPKGSQLVSDISFSKKLILSFDT